ncbi:uncharacterized protein PG998_002333 [Apiospora kogelbergensis]|uniref:uncharacterized protein n=1 Tax=Apiospora kogelbergensis TaxID=1337665 RepID=UPI00313124A6
MKALRAQITQHHVLVGPTNEEAMATIAKLSELVGVMEEEGILGLEILLDEVRTWNLQETAFTGAMISTGISGAVTHVAIDKLRELTELMEDEGLPDLELALCMAEKARLRGLGDQEG